MQSVILRIPASHSGSILGDEAYGHTYKLITVGTFWHCDTLLLCTGVQDLAGQLVSLQCDVYKILLCVSIPSILLCLKPKSECRSSSVIILGVKETELHCCSKGSFTYYPSLENNIFECGTGLLLLLFFFFK